MTKIRIDPLALTTFGRLAGVRAYLELLDKAIPQIEWQERERLQEVAHAEGWDVSDYDVEDQVLDERFKHWIPRFSAYSVIILLHTVLETQVVACAERLCARRGATFTPRDVRGGPTDSALLYVQRLTGHDARQQPEWQQLQDLRDLRNLLVHRAGTMGESDQQRNTAERLALRYKGGIEFPPDSQWWSSECWVSLAMCRRFVDVVEAFFKDFFGALDLPTKGVDRICE